MKKMIFVFMLISLCTSLAAQDNGFSPFQMGIGASTSMTMSGESYVQENLWIAGILHITPRIAVRPQVMVLSNKRERKYVMSDETNNYEDTAFGAGADLLYYVPVADNMFFYTGPSVKYYKYTDKADYANGSNKENIITNIKGGIKVGGQFMLSPNFGFFGDLGIGFENQMEKEKGWNVDGEITSEEENSTSVFSTTGAYLGAVFYIN